MAAKSWRNTHPGRQWADLAKKQTEDFPWPKGPEPVLCNRCRRHPRSYNTSWTWRRPRRWQHLLVIQVCDSTCHLSILICKPLGMGFSGGYLQSYFPSKPWQKMTNSFILTLAKILPKMLKRKQAWVRNRTRKGLYAVSKKQEEEWKPSITW